MADREALAIADLVRAHGYAVIPSRTRWGQRTSLTEQDLKGHARTVVLVETPDPAAEAIVTATGRAALHIDHHLYARPHQPALDRRNPLSSLEQVARLIDAPLDAEQQRIAANDRGHIRALMALPAPGIRPSAAECRALRLEDLTVSEIADREGAPQGRADLTKSAFTAAQAGLRDRLAAAETAVRAALSESTKDEPKARDTIRLIENGRTREEARRLLIVHLDDTHARVGLDALFAVHPALQPDGEAPLPECLLLFHDAKHPDRLTQVEFSGAGSRSDTIAEWIAPAILRAWGAQRLTVFAGGGPESGYFVAKDSTGQEAGALNSVADGLLIRNRPLEAWRTSFFQPLYLGSSDAAEDGTVAPLKDTVLDHLQTLRTKARARWKAEDEPNSETDAACPAPGLDMPHPVWVDPAERAYFLPHLRGILLDEDQQPDEAHRCSDDAWTDAVDAAKQGNRLVSFALPTRGLALETKIRGYPDTVRLPIRELRAHFFFNDTCILEWTLEQSFAETSEGPFWMALLSATPTPGAIESLDQVIDVNAWLRFTSSTRKDDPRGPHTRLCIGADEKEPWTHGDTVSRSPLVGWFADLVEHALGLTNKGLKEASAMPLDVRFLADDRARVLTSVVVRGGIPRTAPARSAWDACLARLHMVDPADDGFEYDATFSRDELRRGGYWRFENMGTLYAATDHSFAMLAHGWFPRHYIHDRHMRTMYRRMVVVTQFYGAILTAFSVRVSQALELSEAQRTVQERKAVLRRAYQNLHEDQLRFTNHFWFTTLSSQLQGKELFDLLRNQARIEDEYRLVSEEIERMSQFLAALDAEAEGRRERTLARIGLPFVLFMAIMTLAIDREHHNFWLWPALEHLFTPAGAWFGAGLVAALWSWAVVDWVLRPPEPGRRWWQALTRPSIALSIGSAVVLLMAGLLAPPFPTPCP